MGVAFQGVYALGQFIVMAVLIRKLGPQRFGMWLMIFSLTAWMAFAKFGLQFTLYTALGQHAQTDRDKARAILTNAALFVALLGLLLAAALAAGGWFLPWADWLNVTEAQAVREAGPVTVTVLVLAALSMPLMMGGHALLASQRGDLTQGLALAAQIVMIIVLIVGYFLDWSFITLAIVVMSPPLLAGFTQWCVGLGSHILPRPSISALDRLLMGRLLAAGGLFMLLDLAMITLLQGGPIVLGHAVGPEAVVPYGAAYRLIGLLIAAVMMICYAYWPAYSEAGARQDMAWIRRGVLRSLLLMLGLCVVGGCVILTVGRPFIRWWLGEPAVPTYPTLACAVLFTICFGAYAVLGSPLSGLGRIGVQLLSACVMVSLFITVGLVLSFRHGPAGLYLGQALAALVGAAMNGIFLHRAISNKQEASAQP